MVQSEVAKVFHTRRSPHLKFEFDPSIEGAMRVNSLMTDIAAERAAREGTTGETTEPAEPAASDAPKVSEEE